MPTPLRHKIWKLLAALLVASLSASITISPVQAVEIPATIDGLTIDASDENDNTRPLTHLAGHRESVSYVCDDLEDPKCETLRRSVAAFLLPCSESVTLGCIKEVYAIDASGSKTVGRFIRTINQFDQDQDFTEDRDFNLVAGAGVGGLWSFPGVTHGGKNDLYTVGALVQGSAEGRPSFRYDNLQVAISAVTENSGVFGSRGFDLTPDKTIIGIGYLGGNYCEEGMVQDGTGCFIKERMPEGQRFGLTITLPNSLDGWFHGRIYRPEIIIKEESMGRFSYQIEAEPVRVPIVNAKIPQSSWSSAFIEFVKSRWSIANGGGSLMPGSSGDLAFDLTTKFLPMIDDKSSTSGDFWTVRTLGGWQVSDPKIFACSASSNVVSGIVTTNSMVYTAGPPAFNQETQSLDYRLLSPHYDENGQENRGSYDLLLNSTVARCIYGFSAAPVKAEIQIIGSDGASKVATTLLGEKNDWIFLSANGFTYSDPIVKVKLSQDPPVIKEESSVAQQESKSVTTVVKRPPTKQRVSVTCLKGKKVKNVSAIKSKCPKGFKGG